MFAALAGICNQGSENEGAGSDCSTWWGCIDRSHTGVRTSGNSPGKSPSGFPILKKATIGQE
ncbi:MAG: hypothetical protein CBC35_10895 [Planctomycetes bacterium TMED75]|nr:hypothetical protein [Planctomycetaceae bacterium]OUU90759.1 MAG: hypothetical protein CBC35_10895 [Planctomycetes bacterium TMED75]